MHGNHKCRITMLKVADGDCFFVEFFYEENSFNILVDTGPVSCWGTVLKPFLDQLIVDGKKIDVLLITHIDGDHIGGAIKLFESEKYSSLIDQVWFNGLRQIAFDNTKVVTENEIKAFRKLETLHWHDTEDVNGPISAKQAESLSGLLAKRGIVANSFVEGLSINSDTASIQISPGFFIDFLLPTAEILEKLKTKFQIAMKKTVLNASLVVTSEGESAFEHVMLDENAELEQTELISGSLFNVTNIEKWASTACGNDPSITNASSIAVCIRFYGRKLLFPGDAPAEDLLKALDDWSHQNEENLYFDVVKLPHHGSSKNCNKLLEQVDGRYYLVSTDGVKFAHPSKEAIAKTVVRHTDRKRYLLFNYANEMYELFNNEATKKKYNYCVAVQTTPLEI